MSRTFVYGVVPVTLLFLAAGGLYVRSVLTGSSEGNLHNQGPNVTDSSRSKQRNEVLDVSGIWMNNDGVILTMTQHGRSFSWKVDPGWPNQTGTGRIDGTHYEAEWTDIEKGAGRGSGNLIPGGGNRVRRFEWENGAVLKRLPFVAGTWSNNVGTVFEIVQTGLAFSWTIDRVYNETGTGQIDGSTFQESWNDGATFKASWKGDHGSGSGSGKLFMDEEKQSKSIQMGKWRDLRETGLQIKWLCARIRRARRLTGFPRWGNFRYTSLFERQ